MKIVLNKCYGGFSISELAAAELGLKNAYAMPSRTDPLLIAMVEHDPVVTSGRCAELKVVEIPDCATDWELDEYDGFERVTYVVGGKIFHV